MHDELKIRQLWPEIAGVLLVFSGLKVTGVFPGGTRPFQTPHLRFLGHAK